MRRFPEDSRENNFEKIRNELENDLNKLIKEIDFEILSNIFGNLKCNKRFQRNDKQYLEIMDEYELNNKVMKIVKEYLFLLILNFIMKMLIDISLI